MSDKPVDLTEDGQRALREAENLCWRTNVAILAPEHLLGGCLTVLAGQGHAGLPEPDAIKSAVSTMQGVGSEQLKENVMWGSAARMALNDAARSLRGRGLGALSAARIAIGVIDSGEVSPMTFMSLGCPKDTLRAALAEIDGRSGLG